MNIENAHRKFADENTAQDAHVSRETNQIDFVPAKFGDQVTIVDLAVQTFRRKNDRIQAAFARSLDGRCVRAIRNHHRDLGVEPALGDRIRDGQEIRAAAGKQNPELGSSMCRRRVRRAREPRRRS